MTPSRFTALCLALGSLAAVPAAQADFKLVLIADPTPPTFGEPTWVIDSYDSREGGAVSTDSRLFPSTGEDPSSGIVSSEQAAASVPEPTSAALLAASTFTLLLRRRR